MITVLLASYKGMPYLEQQLDSILAQTVPVRIIASDDGSDDGTRELLEKYRRWYRGQVVLLHRKEGGRPGAAWNFFWLLSQAVRDERNEYILLSDQDDVWHNDKVKTLYRRMRQQEPLHGKDHPILVHSDMEVVDENLEEICPSFFDYQNCNPKRTSFSQILVENPVTGGAMMMNRALLELVYQPPKFCCMHDWWIALTASCFGTIEVVDEPLYQYRQHDGNTLGARETGSIQDLKERAGRQKKVEENYRKMFVQGAAFGRQFGKQMDREALGVLHAFLALPLQTPGGRFKNIVRNHFTKSSGIQTLAQCVTIPSMGEKRRSSGAGGRSS